MIKLLEIHIFNQFLWNGRTLWCFATIQKSSSSVSIKKCCSPAPGWLILSLV